VYDLGISLSPATRAYIYFITVPRAHTRGFMLFTRYAGSKTLVLEMMERYHENVRVDNFRLILGL